MKRSIGNDVISKSNVSDKKIENWVKQIEELTRIAQMHPQAVYIAYTYECYNILATTKVSNTDILIL